MGLSKRDKQLDPGELEVRYRQYKEHGLRAIEDPDGEKLVVEGYAVIYDREAILYEDEEEMDIEIIHQGAAAAVLQRQDQRYLYQHNRDMPLARKSIGTLEASEDETGVFIRAELVNNQRGRDAYEDIRSRLVDAQSFAFRTEPSGEEWHIVDRNGKRAFIREIKEFSSLPEFSAVTFPAYEDTTLQARSLDLAIRNRPEPEASGADRAAALEVYRDSADVLRRQQIAGGKS